MAWVNFTLNKRFIAVVQERNRQGMTRIYPGQETVMGKRVILTLDEGSFEQGFPVILRLRMVRLLTLKTAVSLEKIKPSHLSIFATEPLKA
jgi:hypothetical protein